MTQIHRLSTGKVNSFLPTVPLAETTADNSPLPLIYGECSVAGAISYSDTGVLGGHLVRVTWGVGQIFQIWEVYIDDQPLSTLTDISANHYLGTAIQTIDPGMTLGSSVYPNYVEELKFSKPYGAKSVAYSVFFITDAVAATLSSSPRFQAYVSGMIVYDPREAGGNGDPYYDYTGFDLQFIGTNGTTDTTSDYSSHNAATEWFGNAQISNNMLLLDGTGDYVLTADNEYVRPTGDRWTLEMKVKPSTVTGIGTILNRGESSSPKLCFQLYRDGTALKINLSSNGTTWNIASAVSVASFFAINTEVDIRLEFGMGKYRTYKNGILSSEIISSSAVYAVTTRWYIGAEAFGANPWTGSVRCVRFTKGVWRYGGGAIVSGAVPYADSNTYRPGYVYSRLPALAFNDIVQDPFYGLGGSAVLGLDESIDWGEDLIGSDPRTTTGIVLYEDKPTSEWLTYLAMFADCFWFYDGDSIRLSPDRPVGKYKPSGWEITDNGSFIDTADQWSGITGNWSYNEPANVLLRSASASNLIVSQALTLAWEAGAEYVFKLDLLNITAGSCGLYMDGVPYIPRQTVAGTYYLKYTATGDETSTIEVSPTSTFAGWVAECSVYRKYWRDDTVIAGTLTSSSPSQNSVPTVVTAHYTPPADLAYWPTVVYADAKLEGVAIGEIPLIETTLQLPGVQTTAEAGIKARAKLQRLQNRTYYSWITADRGVALQPGTVVELVESSFPVSIYVMVTSIEMIGYGRYRVTGENYTTDNYPADIVEPSDSGDIPVGVITPMKSGASVPTGWELWTTAGSKLIKGAGTGVAVAATGGTNTINVPGMNTGTGGAHTGTNTFPSLNEKTIAGAFTKDVYTNFLSAGGHLHAINAITLTAVPYVRRMRFIKKTGTSASSMPPEAAVFGRSGISVPNLQRSLAHAGRLLQQYTSEANSGASNQVVTGLVIGNTDNTHGHYSYVSTPNRVSITTTTNRQYYESVSGGVHNHNVTAGISLLHLIKQKTLAFYEPSGTYNITQGVIFMWEGSLTDLPLHYTLMNGKLGTWDLTDCYIKLGSNSSVDGAASPYTSHNAWLLGNTSVKGDGDHRGTNYIDDTATPVNIWHDEATWHSHTVSYVETGWQPPYYALAFIMYNPNPVSSFIDVGLLIHAGGTAGGTTIDDGSSYNLTATVSGAPNYSNTQLLFGATTIFNTTGDRLSYASYALGRKFTFEGFFRCDTAASGVMFGNRVGSTAERFSVQYTTGTGVEFVLDGSVVATSADPGINAWFYVSLCYDAANWRFYYGLQSGGVASLVDTVADVQAAEITATLYVGASDTNTTPFRGYYAELRHMRGDALYSVSSYNIPAARFPTA